MILSEQHIIKKSRSDFKKIDNLAFLSKNLYNVALYTIKKHYEETGKHLSYNQLYRKLYNENNVDFKALPNNCSQQILMLVDQNFRSFYAAVRSYKKSKNRFKAPPKPPRYKHKSQGRNVFVFSNIQVRLRDGKILFPEKLKLKPVTTKVDNIRQVRIIPKTSCYVLEVIYERKENQHDLNYKQHLAIDLGINNLATVVSDQPGFKPFLINGRPLKSMNQFYNKKKAELQSKLKNNRRTSKRIQTLSLKRNNKIKHYMHLCSKYIVQEAVRLGIGNIIIGYNQGWKQRCDLGKKFNQKFTQIPFLQLINQIKYKAELEGIKVILQEESYTSKCSALDLEEVKKHDKYLGMRLKRGIFESSTNVLINADVNGALNILRKATNDEFLVGRGLVVNPVKVVLSQIV